MNDDQTRKTSATGAVESMFPPARELILAGLTFTFFSLEIGILPYLTHACGAFWLFRGFGKLRDLNRPFRQAYRISAAFLLWHVLLFGILVSPAVRILEGVFLTAGLTACRIAMLGFTRKGFRELCDRQGIVPDRDPFLWLAVSQGVLLCAGLTPGLSGVTLIGWASVLWIVYLLYSAAKLTSSIGKQLPPVPAPDRFPGERWMAPACAAACILLASTCVFWNHRPPAAAEVPSRSAEAAQIQAHLAALGAPEQVLSDLTDQDLLTLSSVTEVQVQEERVSFSIRHSLSDQEEQSLYSTAVCFLTEDQRTFVLEHFTCSGIAPFWQDGLWINSILPPWQPSGQVLFSRRHILHLFRHVLLGPRAVRRFLLSIFLGGSAGICAVPGRAPLGLGFLQSYGLYPLLPCAGASAAAIFSDRRTPERPAGADKRDLPLDRQFSG